MIEREYIIDDYVMVGNKKFMLNLNAYRNACFHLLSDAKINFKNELLLTYPELRKIKAHQLKLNYTIFPHNAGLFDTGNIIAVVDKFFLDALKIAGCIPDDNYLIVQYDAPPTVFNGIARENKCKKIVIKCEFF